MSKNLIPLLRSMIFTLNSIVLEGNVKGSELNPFTQVNDFY